MKSHGPFVLYTAKGRRKFLKSTEKSFYLRIQKETKLYIQLWNAKKIETWSLVTVLIPAVKKESVAIV